MKIMLPTKKPSIRKYKIVVKGNTVIVYERIVGK
jgi:hypothetical protein